MCAARARSRTTRAATATRVHSSCTRAQSIGMRGATSAPGAHLVQARVLPPREHLVAALLAAGAVSLRARASSTSQLALRAAPALC